MIFLIVVDVIALILQACDLLHHKGFIQLWCKQHAVLNLTYCFLYFLSGLMIASISPFSGTAISFFWWLPTWAGWRDYKKHRNCKPGDHDPRNSRKRESAMSRRLKAWIEQHTPAPIPQGGTA